MKWTTCAVYLVGILLCQCAAPAYGQDVPSHAESKESAKKVLADWAKRQERIKVVRYRVEGEITFPSGAVMPKMGGAVNAEDVVLQHKCVLLLDFRTQRHRIEQDKESYVEDKSRVHRQIHTLAFDGSAIWASGRVFDNGIRLNLTKGRPRPDIVISKGNMDGYFFDLNLLPLYVGHGVGGFLRANVLLPGKWNIKPDLADLHFQRKDIFEKRLCLVFRTNAQGNGHDLFTEYWIDLTRDCALVRILDFTGKKVLVREMKIDYQQTTHGWLPRKWTDRSPSGIGTIRQYRIAEIAIDPVVKVADFQIDREPGMLIERRMLGAPRINQQADPGRYYRISEKGEENEVEFDTGVERKR